MKLTTHLHLVPRSRMRGAISPLPQYVFMAWCLVKHRERSRSKYFPCNLAQRCCHCWKYLRSSCCGIESRDSSFGIALGHGLDDRVSRVRFLAVAGNFSLHHRVQNGSGAHPASYPMGTRGSFPGVKWPGREANHSI
jgi:hypothetical protein